MIIILMVALSALKGALSERSLCTPEPFEKCKLDLTKIAVPSSKERLQKFCPTMKEFYKCFKEKNKKHSLDNSCDTEFNYITSAQEMIMELCDHGSRFHKDFFNSLPCFFTMEDQLHACNKKTADMYQRYRALLSDENFKRENSASLDNCLNVMNRMMCLHTKIQETCGLVELRLFIEIMERSGYFQMYCSEKDISYAEQIVSLVSNLMQSEEPIHFTIRDLFDFLSLPEPCPSTL